jgi:predicted DNA-binding WGR domain protein
VKAHLTYQDDKSNKFWRIETEGETFTVTFGRIGAEGQSQTKEFEDEDECLREAEKLVKEKLKKGYVVQSMKEDDEKEEEERDDEDAGKQLTVAELEEICGVKCPPRL